MHTVREWGGVEKHDCQCDVIDGDYNEQHELYNHILNTSMNKDILKREFTFVSKV